MINEFTNATLATRHSFNYPKRFVFFTRHIYGYLTPCHLLRKPRCTLWKPSSHDPPLARGLVVSGAPSLRFYLSEIRIVYLTWEQTKLTSDHVFSSLGGLIANMQIFVKTLTGKTITLEVSWVRWVFIGSMMLSKQANYVAGCCPDIRATCLP